MLLLWARPRRGDPRWSGVAGNVASIDLSPGGDHIVFSSRPLPRYTVRLRDLSGLIAAQSMP